MQQMQMMEGIDLSQMTPEQQQAYQQQLYEQQQYVSNSLTTAANDVRIV